MCVCVYLLVLSLDLFCFIKHISLNVVRVVDTCVTGDTLTMEGRLNTQVILIRKPEEWRPLGGPNLDRKIILK